MPVQNLTGMRVLSLESRRAPEMASLISSYGGQAVRERIDIGGRIPESVTLMAFPEEVVTEVPRLRDYRYVFVQDDIAIVDPHDTTVLVKIDH